MEYRGDTMRLKVLEKGMVELIFDRASHSANKLDEETFSELEEVLNVLYSQEGVRGLLLSSAKQNFIVGADLAELAQTFQQSEEGIIEDITKIHTLLNRLEDLPFPTVSLINGLALGGGFEICLATDYRVMAAHTKIGQPEVKFGIIPGYGATVRLSRVIGAQQAAQWISSGRYIGAEQALSSKAVDEVADSASARSMAIELLEKGMAGAGYRQRRLEKTGPLDLPAEEALAVFGAARDQASRNGIPGSSAPLVAVEALERHASLPRKQAMEVEAEMVSRVVKEPIVASLIGTFLAEQCLERRQKECVQVGAKVKTAAVLGAGVMGGGIAYQSALKGTPIVVKDIDDASIAIALDKASELATRYVMRKKQSEGELAAIVENIHPTLVYEGFGRVDFVIEAVTEKFSVKSSVLQDCEKKVPDNTILASNTSTISITKMAETLQRPEYFCGMHFFNPVDKMPLVEIVRGARSSEKTIATAVSYALSMGKKPVVVNDCPGFLVNRILFPYVFAFLGLLREGIPFLDIDAAMKGFGWPMGPALLCDVVGIDVLVHAGSIMSEAYPDRMSTNYQTALLVLSENGLLGQKSGEGFYRHAAKVGPEINDHAIGLLRPHCDGVKSMDALEIVERMMLPLCLEAVRCLEEGVVEEAADLDLALIYGIGFPQSLGGALRYIESRGLPDILALAERYSVLGSAYHPPQMLRARAELGQGLIVH